MEILISYLINYFFLSSLIEGEKDMSLKNLPKIFLPLTGLLCFSLAFAGGPEEIIPQIYPPIIETAIYVEGDLGGASANWGRDNKDFGFNKEGRSAFTIGGATGYQWSRFLGFELGGFHIADTHLDNFRVPEFEVRNARISSWFYYAGLRVRAGVPMCDNLDVFIKAGVSYRRERFGGSFFDLADLSAEPDRVSANAHIWNSLFGAGLQYNLSPDWFITGQWMILPRRNSIDVDNDANGEFHERIRVPTLNVFTFGIGYKFNV